MPFWSQPLSQPKPRVPPTYSCVFLCYSHQLIPLVWVNIYVTQGMSMSPLKGYTEGPALSGPKMHPWAPDSLPGDKTSQPVPGASLTHPPRLSPDGVQAVLLNLLKKSLSCSFFFISLFLTGSLCHPKSWPVWGDGVVEHALFPPG